MRIPALIAGVSAAVLSLAPAAIAADRGKVSVDISGFLNAAAAFVDQDEGPFVDLRDYGLAMEAEIHFKAKATLDNGLHLGMRAELELNRDNKNSFGPPGTGSESDDIIDEVYLFVEGDWGQVQFGNQDGAADQLAVFAPTTARATRINDGEIYFFEDGNNNDRFQPIVLRTDVYASDDNMKIIYFTPRWMGLQAGVSYMPEPTKNFSGFASRADNEFAQQSEMWEFGVNYQRDYGNIHVAADVTYLAGSNEDPASIGDETLYGLEDDLEEWGAGLVVGIDFETTRLIVGGSYRNSNASRGIIFADGSTFFVDDAVDTEIWELGAMLQRGPWRASVGYIEGTSQDLAFIFPGADILADVDGHAYEASVGYVLGPGIQFTLGYQHFTYEQDPLLFTFFNDEFEASADIVYLETALQL